APRPGAPGAGTRRRAPRGGLCEGRGAVRRTAWRNPRSRSRSVKGSSRIRNDSIKEAPVAEGGLGWTGCATAPRLSLAMRQLTQFDEEALASRFRDFMQAEGIEATVSPSA